MKKSTLIRGANRCGGRCRCTVRLNIQTANVLHATSFMCSSCMDQIQEAHDQEKVRDSSWTMTFVMMRPHACVASLLAMIATSSSIAEASICTFMLRFMISLYCMPVTENTVGTIQVCLITSKLVVLRQALVCFGTPETGELNRNWVDPFLRTWTGD